MKIRCSYTNLPTRKLSRQEIYSARLRVNLGQSVHKVAMDLYINPYSLRVQAFNGVSKPRKKLEYTTTHDEYMERKYKCTT